MTHERKTNHWSYYVLPAAMMSLLQLGIFLPVLWICTCSFSSINGLSAIVLFLLWLILFFLPNSILCRNVSDILISLITAFFSMLWIPLGMLVSFILFHLWVFPGIAQIFIYIPPIAILLFTEVSRFSGSWPRVIGGTIVLIAFLFFVAFVVGSFERDYYILYPSIKMIIVYPIVAWLAIPWILGRTVTEERRKRNPA